jgi:AAA domain, putative AbiEii toxin, Type IV TA system
MRELFSEFQRTAQETWPGIRVRELAGGNRVSEDPLILLVQNEGFVADISSMGHGLQMWLQTIWFLTRSRGDATVILDEPDVYMHADLQRKLIRFLRNQNRQIIVTTHSVEIMAEVGVEDILIVDRRKPRSNFASSLPAVQRVLEHIGSAHNIHLAKLWSARRCLLVEGKDIKLLKLFQNSVFPDSTEPFDAMPNMAIGGWGGWNYAVGSSMLLSNAGGDSIITYCILDRDYHTDEEINRRMIEAKSKSVQLHIWRRKEIENYLLNPDVIHRAISTKIANRTSPPTVDEIYNKLEEIMNDLKDSVFDALSTEHLAQNRARGASGANQAARQVVNSQWATFEGRVSITPGKEVIRKLSEWSQQEFGVGLNALLIVRNMRVNELPDEVASLVTSIENMEPFLD